MRKAFIGLGFLILTLFLVSLAFVSAAEIGLPEISKTNVSYFYSVSCTHCQNVADSGILEEVGAWENVHLEKYETTISDRNRDLYLSYVDKFGINKQDVGIPFLVVEQEGKASYLMGDTPIINELEDSIINFNGVVLGGGGFFDDLTLGVVIVAALIDSINPCAFGVLLFLMAVMLSMGSSKRALRIGLIYTFVIFVVYLLAGIGIIKIINSLDILKYVSITAGVIVLIGGLIELKDFFWEGKGVSLRIPTSAKPLLERYVHKGTLSAIIILGVLVALVELPCTGGIYFAILSLISQSGTVGMTYLVIYNIIFVLPLALISYMIYRGMRVEKINEWVQNNKKYMRLAAGIIMILLALRLLSVI